MTETRQVDFDDYAGDYDRALAEGLAVSGENKEFFARGRIEWLARIGFSRPGSVLDYGCGTGSSSPFLVEVLGATRVTGIDVSVASLDVARRTHATLPAEFTAVNAFKPTSSFDLAFTNGVFHHIPVADRDAAIDLVYQSLRPGGAFAFFENNPWNLGTRYVMSQCPFDADAIMLSPLEAAARLRRAGFEISRRDFLFFFPRALKPLRSIEPSLSKVPLGAQYLVLATKPLGA